MCRACKIIGIFLMSAIDMKLSLKKLIQKRHWYSQIYNYFIALISAARGRLGGIMNDLSYIFIYNTDQGARNSIASRLGSLFFSTDYVPKNWFLILVACRGLACIVLVLAQLSAWLAINVKKEFPLTSQCKVFLHIMCSNYWLGSTQLAINLKRNH